MTILSPAKLLVILVIALMVLGPDKLPKVAKQAGGLWRDFRRFREKLESEVRGTFPDLPSTETITQAVRSPLTLFDTLADVHGPADEAAPIGDGGSEPVGTVGDAQVDVRAPAMAAVPAVDGRPVRSDGPFDLHDPGMN